MNIIGIDCATVDKRVGLAFGTFENGKTSVLEVGTRAKPVVATVGDWLARGQPTLIALDAPLGWPRCLSQELKDHRAGMPVYSNSNRLFSRTTDRFIFQRPDLKKRPLEVGADRIARTAVAALTLLQDLREKNRLELPLAWSPESIVKTCAIEVYPAATRLAKGIEPNVVGREVVEALKAHMSFLIDFDHSDRDTLDASICVLAASDFLRGECIPPEAEDQETIRQEGWIWVAKGR